MDEQKNQSRIFRTSEELISMFLGLAIVLVVFLLVVNFFQKKRSGTVDVPGVSDTSSQQQVTPSPVKVTSGAVAAAKVSAKPTRAVIPTKAVVPTKKVEVTKAPEPTKAVVSPNPTVKPEKEAVPGGESKTYEVKKGDSLWKIATAELGSGYRWVEIQKLNKLRQPGQLAVGQKLTLPAEEKQPVITHKAVPNPIEGNEYTVVKGDHLSRIALRAYGDSFAWPRIYEANKKLISNPNLIFSGWKLTIPR
ncbi:LysM peptidoglycan-binding domain-containing protein [Patescibacteria group bacterium]|nr:LysM peptidoglycan-binding domain-containing protein [Patescibacteria group bacterium]